jgi:hypothetical protein
MMIALSVVAAGAIPWTLHAQSSELVPDSVMPAKSTVRTGLNLNTLRTTNAAGTANGYNNNFLKGIGSYKLNLANGLSLKTDGISATNALNPANFRRENILPREELLYGQHLTLGASYNGLNNMLRGGAGGMNGRNPGLSLHAGISF